MRQRITRNVDCRRTTWWKECGIERDRVAVLASSSAWRSVPGPLSAVLVTTKALFGASCLGSDAARSGRFTQVPWTKTKTRAAQITIAAAPPVFHKGRRTSVFSFCTMGSFKGSDVVEMIVKIRARKVERRVMQRILALHLVHCKGHLSPQKVSSCPMAPPEPAMQARLRTRSSRSVMMKARFFAGVQKAF